MLDKKKIEKTRTNYLKVTSSDVEVAKVNWKRLASRVSDFPVNGPRRNLAFISTLNRFPDHWGRDIIRRGTRGNDINFFRNHLALVNGAFLCCMHLNRTLPEVDPDQDHSGTWHFGENLLYLHASGHSDLACKEVEFSFSDKKVAKDYYGGPKYFDRDREDWFAILFSLENPSRVIDFGIRPKAEQMGPYWMLVDKWDDLDPENVRNVLTAVREQGVAAALVPETKEFYRIRETLLLWDYEVRAVNARRVSLGLEPVTLAENYLEFDPLGEDYTPVPFARDNIFWPAHLKICEELGVPHYEFKGDVIDVEIDPETGEISA